MCGYTTPRAALAAIAASTAEPPAFSASTPAPDASACGHVTMPRNASVGGREIVRSRSPARDSLRRLGKPHRRADLGDLAGVVVPVVVEHRADEHRDRDLVRAHECPEERDAGLLHEVRVA